MGTVCTVDQLNRGDLVKIQWWDHSGFGAWKNLDEIRQEFSDPVWLCETVGWVWNCDNQSVLICASRTVNQGRKSTISDGTRIVRSAIHTLVVIETAIGGTGCDDWDLVTPATGIKETGD